MSVAFSTELSEFTNTPTTGIYTSASIVSPGAGSYGLASIVYTDGTIDTNNVVWDASTMTLLTTLAFSTLRIALFGVASPTTGTIKVDRQLATALSIQASTWTGTAVLATGTVVPQDVFIASGSTGITVVTGPSDMAVVYTLQTNPSNAAVPTGGQTALTDTDFALGRTRGAYKLAGTNLDWTISGFTTQHVLFLGVPLLSSSPVVSDTNALSFGHAL